MWVVGPRTHGCRQASWWRHRTWQGAIHRLQTGPSQGWVVSPFEHGVWIADLNRPCWSGTW